MRFSRACTSHKRAWATEALARFEIYKEQGYGCRFSTRQKDFRDKFEWLKSCSGDEIFIGPLAELQFVDDVRGDNQQHARHGFR